MKLRTLGCAVAALGMFATVPVRGAIVISEVVFNEVGSDVTGEWIEIYNNGTTTVDLSDYKIGDEETSGGTGTTEALHKFPAGSSIGPGQVQIIAVNATTFFTHYGVLPTYEATANNAGVPDMSVYAPWDSDGIAFNMANTNDQAVLLDNTDTIIDAVSWGSSTFAFNPPLGAALDGQGYQRINGNIDTGTASDWEAVADSSVPAAQRSTPFVVPVPEPASVGLALMGGLLAVRRPRARRR